MVMIVKLNLGKTNKNWEFDQVQVFMSMLSCLYKHV